MTKFAVGYREADYALLLIRCSCSFLCPCCCCCCLATIKFYFMFIASTGVEVADFFLHFLSLCHSCVPRSSFALHLPSSSSSAIVGVAHLRLLLPLSLCLCLCSALFMLLALLLTVGQNFICRSVQFSWLLNIYCNSSRRAMKNTAKQKK